MLRVSIKRQVLFRFEVIPRVSSYVSFGVCLPQNVTPHNFRAGQKLEAVDQMNTALTCVATVSDVLGDRILIHFDGWEEDYDYWCDPTSPYIHPVGWCQTNGVPLSPPNGKSHTATSEHLVNI